MIKRFLFGFWLVLGFLVSVPAVSACETAALQAQVKSLQAQVRDLKAQLHTGVTVPPPPSSAESANSVFAWRHQWRQIRTKMTEPEILRLLGKPQQVLHIGSGPVWYYHYAEIGSGSVVFNNSHQVLVWQEPPFGQW
ncbi:MAG: hypothetical protein ACYDEV_02210 [Acidiferrobacter sp.]